MRQQQQQWRPLQHTATPGLRRPRRGTTSVHVNDDTGASLEGARVYIIPSVDTGAMYFEEPPTQILSSNGSAVATFRFVAHGYAVGDWVLITGAIPEVYNGLFQVSNANNADRFSYVMDSDPGVDDSGAGVLTAVVISGLTDVNGDISDTRTVVPDQPIVGHCRMSTVSPFFKTFPIAGTIDSETGFTANIQMVKDE